MLSSPGRFSKMRFGALHKRIQLLLDHPPCEVIVNGIALQSQLALEILLRGVRSGLRQLESLSIMSIFGIIRSERIYIPQVSS